MEDEPSTPFAVVYRWSVEPEHEKTFIERWNAGTKRLRDIYGSLGSCLCRAENGDFIAFARWPNESTRREAFAQIQSQAPWLGVRSFEETGLSVVNDLLTYR